MRFDKRWRNLIIIPSFQYYIPNMRWKATVIVRLFQYKSFIWSVNNKNLPASRAHSHRAQLASLASLSAPGTRDLIVALRDRSCALRIHLSLFIIIRYWKAQTNFIIILQMMWITHFLKVTQFLLNLSETGNSKYLRLHQPRFSVYISVTF